MDTRSARRAAEKAARDLIATRAAVVGDLGVLVAERTARAAAVADCQHQGQALVRAAQQQAEQLVSAAQQAADEAAARYSDGRDRALGAGWSSSDLDALGFTAITEARARGRRASTNPSAAVPARNAAAG